MESVKYDLGTVRDVVVDVGGELHRTFKENALQEVEGHFASLEDLVRFANHVDSVGHLVAKADRAVGRAGD